MITKYKFNATGTILVEKLFLGTLACEIDNWIRTMINMVSLSCMYMISLGGALEGVKNERSECFKLLREVNFRANDFDKNDYNKTSRSLVYKCFK